MKKLALLLSFLMLASCAQSNETTMVSYNDTNNSACSVKSWSKADFPIMVSIPAEMEDMADAFEASANSWNVALRDSLGGRDAIRILFNKTPNTQWSTPTASLSDTFSGIYEIYNWNYADVDDRVLAFTGTKCQSNRILSADILFNDNFNFDDATRNPQSVDFESVLTHELGHFLGLNHVNEVTSIMYPSISMGVAKRSLTSSDLARIRDLYK